MDQTTARQRILAGAATLLCVLVVPIAAAGAGDSGPAKAAGVKKQIKKLKKRVAALEARPQPTTLPPSGPAGGDLTGSYPDPSIAGGAVISAKVADGTLTGADLADGTLTSADFAPGATSARAYGRVSGAGVLSRSQNVASVTHPFLGIYCIALASSIDPSTAVLVAGSDFGSDGTSPVNANVSVAEWNAVGGNCPGSGDMQVNTLLFDGDDLDDNVGGDALPSSNEGFAFVVP